MFIKADNISPGEIQQLIRGCLAKDRSSQKRMYETFASAMMVLSLQYSKNRQEAEEVLQDAFLQMYKSIHQFEGKGSFEGWFRKIVINCALQRYRSPSGRLKIIAINQSQYALGPFVHVPELYNEKDLLHLIQLLPPACQMVFNLYVFEGFKHREIAEILDISEGTSKSNLFDARAILKKYLWREIKIAR